jgi:hypothetical protein
LKNYDFLIDDVHYGPEIKKFLSITFYFINRNFSELHLIKMRIYMKFELKVILLCFLFIPLSSYSQSSHEEIVDSFLRLQSRRPNMEPSFNNTYQIPRLDEVIPRYMQEQLRRPTPQKQPNFSKFSKFKDLRHRDTPILSQVGPRCSAYGLIASMENLLDAPSVAKLSEAHLWYSYRKYSSAQAVETAKRMAVTESQSWPHERKNPYSGWKEKTHTSLKHITYIEDDIEKAVAALDEGRPVYIGFSVTRSLQACESVLDPISSNTGGGHAVSISGYGLDERIPGGGYFILKNSWGKDCGEEGYSYMPFNYCTRGGSSYCIMWDLQGVSTKFPGVSSVEPEIPEFNINEINVRMSYSKPCLRSSRRVSIKVEGNSLHARQIKEIAYSLNGGETFSRAASIDIDTVYLSFLTKKTAHDILLRITLNNGEILNSQHRWSL